MLRLRKPDPLLVGYSVQYWSLLDQGVLVRVGFRNTGVVSGFWGVMLLSLDTGYGNRSVLPVNLSRLTVYVNVTHEPR